MKSSMRWKSWVLVCLVSVWVGGVQANSIKTTQYEDWASVCDTSIRPERCEIRQVLRENAQTGGAQLLKASLSKVDDQFLLQLLFPMGIDLRPGIALQIDQQQEQRFQFLTCTQAGCLVAIPVDQAMMINLRAGQVVKLGLKPLNAQRPVVMQMSLRGFNNASQQVK
ncbi:invasion associated locus B family protein [Nitrincola tapanii]|uniref:Invasion associated locus B family protein n=1 Tax=Nitrincola tapanii TaxID=1708751 RepID=A0A5A9W184_9GAMM|nr:invasion associated locus B family protein [Nitrincola tapanii]KAA0873979.1 hypothetical protein E1H14_11560 [Nitrincola tapanii]